MAMNNPYSKKALSVREQLARVRGLYPHFWSVVRKGMLQIEGDLRPTARSIEYRVRIEYEMNSSPNVWVVSPKLEPRELGGSLKHVYPGNRLCLYLPNTGEWTRGKSLAHTIIPWTTEWLFHYEVWHATGVWCGGGVEPRSSRTIRREMKD